MNKLTDVDRYPTFIIRNKNLIPVELWEVEGMTFTEKMEWNHFVRKSIRKNSLDFYKRVEHLQKMILMTAEMNKDLETMGADGFFKKYGMKKDDLVFSRLKWREGYYE